MRVQSINLNLIPTGVMPIVHLSQYDRDADGALLFNIFNGPAPFNLTGCTATINGTKPDGNVYTYPCTVHSNFLTSAVYDQMTTVQGTHEAEIRISDGDSVVGTLNFQMAIEKAGVSEIDVSHTDVPTLLENIQASVDEAEYWAEQAASAVTGVSSFNGRHGSVLPIAGDYDSEKILLASALHIGGETQNNVQEALEALSNDGVDGVKSFNGRSGSVLPMAGDYNAEQISYNQTSNVGIELGNLSGAIEAKASKTDLASINATGTINTTGTPITKGTYFYLNGDYVRAKADIANGATFTIGTNVEATTVGDGLKGNMYSGTSLATLNALIAALTPGEYANSALGVGGQLYFPRDDAGSNTYRRYQYILLMASNSGIQYYVKTYDHTTSKLTQGQKNTDGSISSSDVTSTMTSWNLYVK